MQYNMTFYVIVCVYSVYIKNIVPYHAQKYGMQYYVIQYDVCDIEKVRCLTIYLCVCVYVCMCVCVCVYNSSPIYYICNKGKVSRLVPEDQRERERETHTHTQTHSDRDRDRERYL